MYFQFCSGRKKLLTYLPSYQTSKFGVGLGKTDIFNDSLTKSFLCKQCLCHVMNRNGTCSFLGNCHVHFSFIPFIFYSAFKWPELCLNNKKKCEHYISLSGITR